MAIALLVKIPGMTQAQADAVMHSLNLGGKPPTGQILHFEGTLDGTFMAVDVWESQAAVDTFMLQQLGPLFQQHGITSQPSIQTFEAHNILK
jgi:hypothetical protein